MDAEESTRPYVDIVRERQQRYVKDLIRENETLRTMAATLESDFRRLQAEVLDARSALEQREEGLRRRLSEIEAENRRYAERYAEIERQSGDLANLYVASYQLNSTVERAQVLTSIKEIVINLIGSENFGVFERESETGDLHLATSFGIDTDAFATLTPGETRRDELMTSGALFVADPNEPFPGLLASIPLNLDGELIGVIAIFGLLAHKPALESVDLELFDLLAAHASRALYCANLHAARVAERSVPA